MSSCDVVHTIYQSLQDGMHEEAARALTIVTMSKPVR